MKNIKMEKAEFSRFLGVLPSRVGSGSIAEWKDVYRVQEVADGVLTGRWIVCKPVRNRLYASGKQGQVHLQMPPISASPDCSRSNARTH